MDEVWSSFDAAEPGTGSVTLLEHADVVQAVAAQDDTHGDLVFCGLKDVGPRDLPAQLIGRPRRI